MVQKQKTKPKKKPKELARPMHLTSEFGSHPHSKDGFYDLDVLGYHFTRLSGRESQGPCSKVTVMVDPELCQNHVSSSRRVITRSQARSKPLLENPKRSNLGNNYY